MRKKEDPQPEEAAENSIWRGGDFEKPVRHPQPLLTPFVCTLMLLVSCGNMFLIYNGKAPEEPWGYASGHSILSGAYWGYLTGTFVHIDPLHLLFNLYGMWMLGNALERAIGPWRWIAFFVTSAWVSSGIQFLFSDPGIGMSGVAYAMFGFGWVARSRMVELERTVTDHIVRLYIVWQIFCFISPYIGGRPVGNGAHVGGMLFGMAVAEAFVQRRRVPLMLASIAALTFFSILPLFWNPWSESWVTFKTIKAVKAENYEAAIRGYRRALELGVDPVWVWEGLAVIYGYQRREAEYADALRHLRELDVPSAQSVEEDYGEPATRP